MAAHRFHGFATFEVSGLIPSRVNVQTNFSVLSRVWVFAVSSFFLISITEVLQLLSDQGNINENSDLT